MPYSKINHDRILLGYEIRYERLDKWALIDIGVVKVESPYDFTDESYKTTCSYIPAVIPVSYEAKYQEAGTDAIVFGWGHLFKWRKVQLQMSKGIFPYQLFCSY